MTAPDAKRFVAIVNPTSGGGAGVRMPAELRRAFAERGLAVDLQLTERSGHAVDLARNAALHGVHAVVAVGGDGTVHEVANGLLTALEQEPATPTVLGLVPVGTGNDFVKVIEGTSRRDRAYDTLARGLVQRVDAGFASWDGSSEYFVNAAGTGIDVEVVRVLGAHRGTRGALAYVLALLEALRRYRHVPLRLEADGHVIDRPVMTVAIANGRCIGGTFRICPDASPADGLFDVCDIAGLSLLRSLATAARVIRGTHTGLACVDMRRARTVTMTVPADTQLFFQLDGELREPASARTLRLEIRAGALPVLATPAPGAGQTGTFCESSGGAARAMSNAFAAAQTRCLDAPLAPGRAAPRRRHAVVRLSAGMVTAVLACSTPALAQARADSARADSLQTPARRDTAQHSLSPRGAMFRSFLIPGWGQGSVGSYKRGGVFFAIQGTSWYMLLRTIGRLNDVKHTEARLVAAAADSLQALAVRDSVFAMRLADDSLHILRDDTIAVFPGVATARKLIDARSQQRQDWITYTLFFTLMSGVDAYVNAHLRNFPTTILSEVRRDGSVSFSVKLALPPWRPHSPSSAPARVIPTRQW